MRSFGVTMVGGLAMAAMLFGGVKEAQAGDPTQRNLKVMCDNPIVKKWSVLTPSTGVFACRSKWRFHKLTMNMQREHLNLFKSKRGWNIFQGRRKSAREKAYFVDSLVPNMVARYYWFPIWWVAYYKKGPARAALGVYLYKVPNAAKLIAQSIGTNGHFKMGHSYSTPTAYWALWFLGGKVYADVMIKRFHAKRYSKGYTAHTNFALTVMDRWKLNKSQVKRIESFCVNKVFQPAGFTNATRGCIRYLGRIRTKNSTARQFLVQHAGTSDSTNSSEAIRALGHIGYKGIKGKLKANVAQAKRNSSRLIKRRRRYKRKKVVTYSTHFNSAPSLIALIGMGDRKALKIVKGWLMTYDKRNNIDNNTAFEAAYREGAFASPKAAKKLKNLYRKAFKKALKNLRKNPRMKQSARQAAVALLQMGDKTGLKHVIKVLKDTDMNEVSDVLEGIGANPNRTWGARSTGGIAHIKVGKKGLSVKDAQKLVNTIKGKFMFWRGNKLRTFAIHAVADIEAQILIVKNKL